MALGEAHSRGFDELEIRLSQDTTAGYRVELVLPDGLLEGSPLGELPCEELGALHDARQYGVRLFEWLLQGPVRPAFERARRLAEQPSRLQTAGGGLRLRLCLGLEPDSRVQTVWWEALFDPERNRPLGLDLAFSRYLPYSTRRGAFVRERPLRMLLAASDPEGVEPYGLAPLNAYLETATVRDATRSFPWLLAIEQLASRPTFDQLRNRAGKGFHLVHLSAHALFQGREGSLVLADEQGKAALVPAAAVAEAIATTPSRPPFLVFLATPPGGREPSGASDRTPVSLAPTFLRAGAQAVVALHAAIPTEELRRFVERFYAVLCRTGVVDLALAVARAELYNAENPARWEWTYPVVYSRTPEPQLFEALSVVLESAIAGFHVQQFPPSAG